jgi:hypothetical protein
MIPTIRLLYKLDQRLNKLSSNQHQRIPLENKILALNEAQLKLIKKKMNPNNPLGIGFDGNKKRYEDLENLVVPFEDTPLSLTETDKKLNKWSASLISKPDYMFYVDSYLLANKEDCKDRVIAVNSDLVKHADVHTLLSNNNYKPSFEYQDTFTTKTSGDIEVYTDGTFTPTKLFVSYLRYPRKIDLEGYEDFDGTPSINSDCELKEYLEDELLDIAEMEIAINTQNIPAAQMAAEKIKNSE